MPGGKNSESKPGKEERRILWNPGQNTTRGREVLTRTPGKHEWIPRKQGKEKLSFIRKGTGTRKTLPYVNEKKRFPPYNLYKKQKIGTNMRKKRGGVQKGSPLKKNRVSRLRPGPKAGDRKNQETWGDPVRKQRARQFRGRLRVKHQTQTRAGTEQMQFRKTRGGKRGRGVTRGGPRQKSLQNAYRVIHEGLTKPPRR